MRRATRATLEVWCGTSLVVVAALLLRVGYSVLRTVGLVVSVLVATGLIVHSIRSPGDDDQG